MMVMHESVSSPKRKVSTNDQPPSEKYTPCEAEAERPLINGKGTCKPAKEMANEVGEKRDHASMRDILAVLQPKQNGTQLPSSVVNGRSEPPGHSSEFYEIQQKPPWALQHPKSAIILPIDLSEIGSMKFAGTEEHPCQDWKLEIRNNTASSFYMKEAAYRLRTSEVPVAFPTETVYGLGADATRSEAVQGIYKAKQRPSDNPLIVHVCSLQQLRKILQPGYETNNITATGNNSCDDPNNPPRELDSRTVYPPNSPIPYDPIPDIYQPLIKKFWPGPLTIILPNPPNSKLAPEVTAGLSTFGARMPKNGLALALIQMAGVPLAAPSANASTKPSPTTAEHVKHDLEGRIDLILDGGPCEVGVESTVVDGLSRPPMILRPGGVSIEQLRACEGWECVQVGYKDYSEGGKPRAPGMKYKHYSPRARVVLHEAGSALPDLSGMRGLVGIVGTKNWPPDLDSEVSASAAVTAAEEGSITHCGGPQPVSSSPTTKPSLHHNTSNPGLKVYSISLGPSPSEVARGLFAALRDLDSKGVDVIFVEGITDEGDIAAAVMNRLRKAAG